MTPEGASIATAIVKEPNKKKITRIIDVSLITIPPKYEYL
jgi:hypothetical protein